MGAIFSVDNILTFLTGVYTLVNTVHFIQSIYDSRITELRELIKDAVHNTYHSSVFTDTPDYEGLTVEKKELATASSITFIKNHMKFATILISEVRLKRFIMEEIEESKGNRTERDLISGNTKSTKNPIHKRNIK